MSEQSAAHFVDYTLYEASDRSDRSVIFFPGMACNRFGHPVHTEPRNSINDLLMVAHDRYNVIFPEIHMPQSIPSTEPIKGLTVEQQTERLIEILVQIRKEVELNEVTFIGQSLGCLAVGHVIITDLDIGLKNAIFWGPPTLEGDDHHNMLISKFSSKARTSVDDHGRGVIQFGDGRIMGVDPAYWRSIDENSLRIHHQAMIENFADITAVCASEGNFYPNNAEYIETHTPGIRRLEIDGQSHTLKEPTTRLELRNIMQKLLNPDQAV